MTTRDREQWCTARERLIPQPSTIGAALPGRARERQSRELTSGVNWYDQWLAHMASVAAARRSFDESGARLIARRDRQDGGPINNGARNPELSCLAIPFH